MSTATATPPPTAAPTAVVEVKKTNKRTFQELVDSDQFKLQIAAALPKHLTPNRFIRVLLTATIKNPRLLECTQQSMFKGIFDCAAIGLELDGRRAHLVPFKNKGVMEATLIVDYKGLAELAMRSGVISNIHADVVCEHDVFEVDRGEVKKHTIDYRKERGEMYATYCIIRMKDGGEKAEVMSRSAVNAIRARSKASDSGPWVTDFDEMAKKTVFKRAAKWVPLSAEMLNVLDAEHEDEPKNVTPKPSLAGLIGAATDGPPEREVKAIEEAPAKDVEHDVTKPATNPVTEVRPAPPAKTYTADERQALLNEVETLMLDLGVSEAKVMVAAVAAGMVKRGQDEVSALDTLTLDGLRAVIPTLKKA